MSTREPTPSPTVGAEIVAWLLGLEGALERVIRNEVPASTSERRDMTARRGIYEGIADDIRSKWSVLFEPRMGQESPSLEQHFREKKLVDSVERLKSRVDTLKTAARAVVNGRVPAVSAELEGSEWKHSRVADSLLDKLRAAIGEEEPTGGALNEKQKPEFQEPRVASGEPGERDREAARVPKEVPPHAEGNTEGNVVRSHPGASASAPRTANPTVVDWEKAARKLLSSIGMLNKVNGGQISFVADELRAVREMPELPGSIKRMADGMYTRAEVTAAMDGARHTALEEAADTCEALERDLDSRSILCAPIATRCAAAIRGLLTPHPLNEEKKDG